MPHLYIANSLKEFLDRVSEIEGYINRSRKSATKPKTANCGLEELRVQNTNSNQVCTADLAIPHMRWLKKTSFACNSSDKGGRCSVLSSSHEMNGSGIFS